ncbi:transposase [Amycolatopsis sp. NBC_01480]|uniref:transposase n=1 Tax=Amycolatopsis sp. NBC_01480 TaxID=2903562 RepID=UPI003FA47427
MREEVLTDRLWEGVEPLNPMRPRRFRYPGRRHAGDRAAREGILDVVHTGIGWNRLPAALFGASGATCWRRLTEWHEVPASSTARGGPVSPNSTPRAMTR